MFSLAKKSVVVAALFASTSAYANSGWTVSEASGSVTVTRGDTVLSVRKNTKLNAGDVIRTGKSSRAVLVRGKEYVVVSPKAHIRIAEPKKTGAVTQIFQYLGNVLFKIEKKSTPHFGVETPYMAAVVKGTTFNVSVTDQGTSVQVTEGAVEVSTGDDLEAALLTPGLVGLVEADDASELIVISGQDEAAAEEAIVRGQPRFVAQLREAPSRTDVANVSVGADRSQVNRNDADRPASNESRLTPAARPIVDSNDVEPVLDVVTEPANEAAARGNDRADAVRDENAAGRGLQNNNDFEDEPESDDFEEEREDDDDFEEDREDDDDFEEEREDDDDFEEDREDDDDFEEEREDDDDGELGNGRNGGLAETPAAEEDPLSALPVSAQDNRADDDLEIAGGLGTSKGNGNGNGGPDDDEGLLPDDDADDDVEDLTEDLGLRNNDDDADRRGNGNGNADDRGNGNRDDDDDGEESDETSTADDLIDINLGLAMGDDASDDIAVNLGLGGRNGRDNDDDGGDEYERDDDEDDRPGRGGGRGRGNPRD